MAETSMLFNIAIIFIAALIGGMIAEALKQSPLIGYMLGGILAGPYVTGMISDLELIQGFADIGVILLMFTLGIEFSLERLSSIKGYAVGGGLLQVVVVVLLSVLLGRYMGLSTYEAVFLGCTLSISSTMIVLRVLNDHGEMNSLHGQLMVGILIVQDLIVIVMVSVLPDLQTFSPEIVPQLIKSLLAAAVIIAAVLYLAPKIIPLLLERAAQGNNNDIFLILALSMGLGVALLAQAMGLSVSLGAFLAGLLITESDYAHEILGKVISLRDAFVIL
ncbi:MAG TPA: cation:proton antiporter, partial [Syntrophomonas sp.]|nr:cation:proton antiporter [Syntrophomonas sp.]